MIPMLLKHATETLLVLFLGMAIVVVGVFLPLLSPLPAGVFLWGGLSFVALGYPLFLFPLFRARRAEYVLRLLHFFPAALLCLWALVQVPSVPGAEVFLRWYTWRWSFLPILFGLTCLFLYCLKVIRQRCLRGVFLSSLLVLMVGVAWGETLVPLPAEGVVSIAPEEPNTRSSSDFHEEVWRMRLRRMRRRQERLLTGDGMMDRPYPSMEGVSVLMNASSSSTPPRLVSSGFDVRGLLLLFLALYVGILHARARRRANSF